MNSAPRLSSLGTRRNPEREPVQGRWYSHCQHVETFPGSGLQLQYSREGTSLAHADPDYNSGKAETVLLEGKMLRSQGRRRTEAPGQWHTIGCVHREQFRFGVSLVTERVLRRAPGNVGSCLCWLLAPVHDAIIISMGKVSTLPTGHRPPVIERAYSKPREVLAQWSRYPGRVVQKTGFWRVEEWQYS